MFKSLDKFKKSILLNKKDRHFIFVEAVNEKLSVRGWINNSNKYNFSLNIKAANQSCDELCNAMMIILNKSIVKGTDIQAEHVESDEEDGYFCITMEFNN